MSGRPPASSQALVARAVRVALAGRKSRPLAEAIGVDYDVVYAWLSGRMQPDTDDIDALAAGLEMSPAELLGLAARQHA